MRLAAALIAATFAASVFAKLPPPTDEAKAKAAEAAAKAAWTDKVGLYQLCLAMDRTAAAYRSSLKAAGKDVPVPVATAPCADAGPYMSTMTPAAPCVARSLGRSFAARNGRLAAKHEGDCR